MEPVDAHRLVTMVTRNCGVSAEEGRSYFTTDGESVCLGIEHPCGTCDQIFLPVEMLLSEICGFVPVGRPL
jgi:hypothetical protein